MAKEAKKQGKLIKGKELDAFLKGIYPHPGDTSYVSRGTFGVPVVKIGVNEGMNRSRTKGFRG
jgi:hypothetical protein